MTKMKTQDTRKSITIQGFYLMPNGMSAKVVKDTSEAGYCLYAYLVDMAGQKGVAWPKVSTIAAAFGWSRAKVLRVVNQLIGAGYVKRIERFGDDGGQLSNTYSVGHREHRLTAAKAKPSVIVGPEETHENEAPGTSFSYKGGTSKSYKGGASPVKYIEQYTVEQDTIEQDSAEQTLHTTQFALSHNCDLSENLALKGKKSETQHQKRAGGGVLAYTGASDGDKSKNQGDSTGDREITPSGRLKPTGHIVKTKNEILVDQAVELVEELNRLADRSFPAKKSGRGSKNVGFALALLKKGYTFGEVKAAIELKCYQWKGTEQEVYLRPSTVFKTKGEQYVEEAQEAKANPRFAFAIRQKRAKDLGQPTGLAKSYEDQEAMNTLKNTLKDL